MVFMLIDSEDPMANIEATWPHLKVRDGWEKPENAGDEQVLMMTTCMETWIVADRAALKSHFGQNLQESGLPAAVSLGWCTRRETASTSMKKENVHFRSSPNSLRIL